MTKTANSYTPDSFEVIFTVTAADATALPEFTNVGTENNDISGSVVDFKEATKPEREFSELYVAGDTSAIKSVSDKVNASVYEITLVDDYATGSATGGYGSDNNGAVEHFKAFFDGRRTISTLKVTPAGGATGNIQTTLTNVDVLSIAEPELMASSNEPATVVVRLVTADKSKAAHA